MLKLKRKTLDHDHRKHITTHKFNKSTADNFAARLAQAKSATKDDIADFVKKTDFNNKIKRLMKKVTLNEIKNILFRNELDELLGKVDLVSTKGLTKDLINKYSILNGAKYFSWGVLQNYLVFVSANKYFKILGTPLRFIHVNLKEGQNKVLKI